MNYRIYGYSYTHGWEIIKIANNMDDAYIIVDNMDPYIYKSYLIISHNIKLNMDEVIDRGFFEKPKILWKSRK